MRGLSRANALINDDPAKAAGFVHEAIWSQTDGSLLEHAVADQRSAFARRMTLTQGQFDQNKNFMLGFGDEVKSVDYKEIIDPSLIDALA